MNRENKQLYKTLDALQTLRTTKNAGDSAIHPKMDAALKECRAQGDVEVLETLLRRTMLHVGDVSRQHNLLNKMSIKSENGGAQERSNFRSLMRWWEKKMPTSFYKDATLEAIYEFTIAENLVYNEIRTDRKTGKVLSQEFMDFDKKKIVMFIAKMIKKGKNVSLWAKHLPKVETGKTRTAKKVMKIRASLKEKSNAETFKWTLPFGIAIDKIKLNGLPIESKQLTENKDGKKAIVVRDGDIVSYPRNKQKATINRQKRDLEIVKLISKELNLDVIERTTKAGHSFIDYSGYKQFRKKQNTAQQKICSGEVFDMSKVEFEEMLNTMTSATQFRVAKMIAYKADDGTLKPKTGKWERLGEVYIEWVKEQEKAADELREAASTGDVKAKAKAMKKFKTKTTGMQTIDMLAEIVTGTLTDTQINNAYQSLIEKMDIIANVFPVVDGSGSMSGSMGSYSYGRGDGIDAKYQGLRLFDVAATLAIAFSTRNPVKDFRNTFGWFSHNFKIIGDSKFVDNRPNAHLASSSFKKQVPRYNVLSETNTYTQNLNNMRKANPGDIAGTNMMAAVEYFVNLVQTKNFSIDELPQALLFITDNEGNEGRSPKDAIKLANSIGWFPLMIYWGLRYNAMDQYKNIDNTLFVGGFNESVLSQILRGIKTGSIDPSDELWSIHDDPRYQVIS